MPKKIPAAIEEVRRQRREDDARLAALDAQQVETKRALTLRILRAALESAQRKTGEAANDDERDYWETAEIALASGIRAAERGDHEEAAQAVMIAERLRTKATDKRAGIKSGSARRKQHEQDLERLAVALNQLRLANDFKRYTIRDICAATADAKRNLAPVRHSRSRFKLEEIEDAAHQLAQNRAPKLS